MIPSMDRESHLQKTRVQLRQALGQSAHPLLIKELMLALKLHKSEQPEIKRHLRKMVKSGEVIRIQGNRYGLPKRLDLVVGRFKGHREGYGFVLPDIKDGEESEEGDVYINARHSNDAMHGDHVCARIEVRKTGGKREGRIIRIIERAHKDLVGRYEVERDYGFVIPAERRIVHDLFIPKGEAALAEHGDIVLAEILAYPTSRRNAEARVIKILGKPTSPQIDTEIVLTSYGLSEYFPDKVTSEADAIEEQITTDMLAGRIDLRGLPTVTIDGEDARDFDDAISIEKQSSGYRLWVHIADVAHYVPEDGALDREAFQRGTSVYFPDKVIPMLPEVLSNGVCSLKPKVDRLTLTVEIDFDEVGNRINHRIYESVIRSNERMTYKDVWEILEGSKLELLRRYAELLPQFRCMKGLAILCRKIRHQRGSLDFELPEARIILSPTGETLDIIKGERNFAHRIIEEFMLAANETVAHYMASRKLPMIYRIHEPPSAERIESFNDLVRQSGFSPKRGDKEADKKTEKKLGAKALSEILEEVKGHPEEQLINQVLLRAMRQACYFEENRGHFGLASPEYTHFTSPIRRYPDLIVHRLLKWVLRSNLSESKKEEWRSKLPSISKQASARERVAVEAEREVIQRKKVKFMSDKIGKRYQGLITGVTAYGLFVMLDDLFIEGMVHVSSLSDDYYLHDEKTHSLIGRTRRVCYRLGQIVEVMVDKADLESWRVDLKIVQRKKKGKSKRV